MNLRLWPAGRCPFRGEPPGPLRLGPVIQAFGFSMNPGALARRVSSFWWEARVRCVLAPFSSRPLLWCDVKCLALARRVAPLGGPRVRCVLALFTRVFFCEKARPLEGCAHFEGALGPVTCALFRGSACKSLFSAHLSRIFPFCVHFSMARPSP